MHGVSMTVHPHAAHGSPKASRVAPFLSLLGSPFATFLFATPLVNSAAAQSPAANRKAGPSFRWVNPLKETYPGIKHATFRSPSMEIPVGYCVYLPPEYDEPDASERRYPVVYYLHGGRESERLTFAPGDNAWDLARRYAMQPEPKLNILVYVGTECFNYENNLEYMAFLESLEIPFRRLIVPDVPHNAKQTYDAVGTELMRFHTTNFGLAR